MAMLAHNILLLYQTGDKQTSLANTVSITLNILILSQVNHKPPLLVCHLIWAGQRGWDPG